MTDVAGLILEFEADQRDRLRAFVAQLRTATAGGGAGDDVGGGGDAVLRQAAVLAPSRFAERDELVSSCFAQFYAAGSARDGAAAMATDLNRYIATGWLRARTESAEPRPDTPQGTFWLILKAVPRALSASRIRRIVAQIAQD